MEHFIHFNSKQITLYITPLIHGVNFIQGTWRDHPESFRQSYSMLIQVTAQTIFATGGIFYGLLMSRNNFASGFCAFIRLPYLGILSHSTDITFCNFAGGQFVIFAICLTELSYFAAVEYYCFRSDFFGFPGKFKRIGTGFKYHYAI